MFLLGDVFQSFGQSLAGLMLEEDDVVGQGVLFLRLRKLQPLQSRPFPGKFEVGGRGVAQLDLQVAFVGNLLSMLQGLGDVGEEPRHLFGGFDVEFVYRVAQTLGIVILFVHGDAHEGLMRLGILGVGVVGVVGGDDLDPGLQRETDDLLVDALLVSDAVAHQFQIEILAEDLLVLQSDPLGLFVAAGAELFVTLAQIEMPVDLPLEAGGGANKPFAVFPQKLLVDPRVVVEAIEIGLGAEIHEVFVSDFVLGEETEVVALAGALVPQLLAVVQIGLHPDDGFDPLFAHRVVEVDGPEHVAVVGHGHRIHPELFDLFGQGFDLVGPVQEGILGMQMEMGESGSVGHGYLYILSWLWRLNIAQFV